MSGSSIVSQDKHQSQDHTFTNQFKKILTIYAYFALQRVKKRKIVPPYLKRSIFGDTPSQRPLFYQPSMLISINVKAARPKKKLDPYRTITNKGVSSSFRVIDNKL
jgi:hypothetical protein